MTHSKELKNLVLIYVKQNPNETVKDISKKFYVSNYAVHRWMKEANIVREKTHIKLLKDRTDFINNNKDIKLDQLAKEFNINKDAVKKYLQTYGLKIKIDSMGYSKEFKNQVIKFKQDNQHLSLKKVGNMFNISATSVRIWCKNNK